MNNFWENIEEKTLELAQVFEPEIRHIWMKEGNSCIGFLSGKKDLFFLGRTQAMDIPLRNGSNPETWPDETLPWYRHQLPGMLHPLLVLDYGKFRIDVMPKIFPDQNTRFATALRKNLYCYGLSADVLGGANVGHLNDVCDFNFKHDDDAVIYDQGAPRLINREKAFEDFNPYEKAPRDNSSLGPQIEMYRRRGYNFRDMAEKAEAYAKDTGGQLVLATNPNICL